LRAELIESKSSIRANLLRPTGKHLNGIAERKKAQKKETCSIGLRICNEGKFQTKVGPIFQKKKETTAQDNK